MKHLIFAGLLLSAFTFKLQTSSSSFFKAQPLYKVAIADTTSIEGQWKLLPVLSSDTAAGKIPEIDFDLQHNRFYGNSGCNKMSGTFIIKQDALSFNQNIITTKMACPGYNEKAFLESLLRTNRYEIKDGVLQLMYNTTVLSKWTRHLNTSSIKKA